MRSGPGAYLLALAAVALVAAAVALWLPVWGLASAALLFLLPVLLASPRGGLGPGLAAAVTGALAYNYFALPPRFSFQVHGLDNVVSLFVLVAVAVVTSRLADALHARKSEAELRAAASTEAAAFAALLGRGDPGDAAAAALDWLRGHYGQTQILPLGQAPDAEPGFSTLDRSAAAWTMHNGDMTGHGTTIMPPADWTFLPLSPRRQSGGDVLAVARPADGETRSEAALDQLQSLAWLLGQSRDRLALEGERHARERLEDRDAFRRALLASLAHDFRTPLTVVTGALDRLAIHDEGAAEALNEARRLDRMMDDLIGAARIEGGALAPRTEAVDLVDSVADACAALDRVLKPLKVTRDVASDLPLVAADPVLLRHVLINLIDNAARHARASIGISARATGGLVELRVRDDGPGISPAERGRVFERFARVEGNDRGGGSGLGLAIVKGFADAMHMTVDIEDMPDGDGVGGACFRLGLPVRAIEAA
ncbi:MAG: DUF4118 domain-containing protein [Sphingobium sp.]|nr:DUF4118 domain-containing protein [Sphingobium sp.]